MSDEQAKCAICGDLMPPGEEMFNYHGYSGPCPKPPKAKTLLITGAEIIAGERKRQIDVEGFTAEHDAAYTAGELAAAAECYVARAADQARGIVLFEGIPIQWPFPDLWWKPSNNPVRNLAKAGALIAAEIDRINRNSI